MSRLCGAAVMCLVGMLALAPSAGASEPINGKPRILALEGFYYPLDESLEHWGVGAVMVSRYPQVLPRDLPGRVRDALHFRVHAGLKLSKGGERIASVHDSGGLPIAIEGRSLYYVHLLLASHKQSKRILDALDLRNAHKGAEASLQTTVKSIERVRSQGETLARASTKRTAATRLDISPTVNGCRIAPRTACPGADLSGANLKFASLIGANLSGANLAGANLLAAALDGADLSRARLSGANLSNARLTRANLSGADLSRADLTRANLEHANLSGASLEGANLQRAIFCNTTMPDGSTDNSGCENPDPPPPDF